MTFDNFNPGRLGFGKKITSAFNSLDEMLLATQDRLKDITQNTEYYKRFKNNNYQAPKPNKPGMPVRTDEFLDVVDKSDIINNMTFDGTNFSVDVAIYNSNTRRVTRAKGNTTLKSGYAIAILSQSLTNLETTIRFSATDDAFGTERTLFKYRIGTNGKIHLVQPEKYIGCYPFDDTQYTSISAGENLPNPYTANDYECIMATVEHAPEDQWRNICVNGNEYFSHTSPRGTREQHAILYLKPGDKVTGGYKNAFRVDYNY